MFKTQLKALVLATSLIGSSAAMATTLTNLDGSFTSWGGIDWDSNGSAVVDRFAGNGSTFNLYFWATATSLKYDNGTFIPEGGLDKGLGDTGTYEYTIFGTLNETASCTTAGCSFLVNSGSFNVYYDTSPEANTTTGLGFTDGATLFSGLVGSQPGGFFTNTSLTDGFGVSVLLASINYTNPLYISPLLSDANNVTTLQVGQYVTTGWTAPTSMPGAGGSTTALPSGALLLQADMNSSVKSQSIPEPGTLALLGVALAGLGLTRRRKTA